jgi:hypothetical protein
MSNTWEFRGRSWGGGLTEATTQGAQDGEATREHTKLEEDFIIALNSGYWDELMLVLVLL